MLPPIVFLGIIIPVSGDRSIGHIAFHVLDFPVLASLFVMARRMINDPPAPVFSKFAWVLVGAAIVMTVGHIGELWATWGTFADDGFRDLEHPEVWEDPTGLHYQSANITLTGLPLALITVLAMTITAAIHDRRVRRIEAPA